MNLNLGEEALLKYFTPSVAEGTEEQKELMAKLIFDHQTEIFINIPNGLQKYKIQVTSISKEGPEDLRVYFSIFSTDNNEVVLIQTDVLLIGFFDFKSPSPISLKLEETEKPKDQYKNQANNGNIKMKDLIWKYKDTIFLNFPKDLNDASWIQITNPATDVAGKQAQLAVGLKIAKDNQEILPEVDVIFDGFKA